MKSVKTILWFTRFGGSLICLLPKKHKAEKLHKTGDYKIYKPYIDKLVLDWMMPLVAAAGVTYNVEGKENIPDDEAVLFVANHQSLFDFPAVLMCLKKPCAFVSKKEAASYPIVNDCMRLMDCVFIDRQNAREAIKALDEAAEIIRSGRSMVIFPEGTRTLNGEIGEFKNGAYKIVEKTHCKVIPLLIDGSDRAFEETGNITSTVIRVKVFEPIDTKDMDRKTIKELMTPVREMLAKELGQASS